MSRPACGPGWSRPCDRNVQTSGICVLIGQELRPIRSLQPGYQGCQRGLVDLVFLFDGSSSMSPAQFGAIRDFMVDVMEKLENSSIRFSSDIQPCFSLADYAAWPRPRDLLKGLTQLGGLTDTFTAIKYVV
nr:integrin alpha-L-like [Columba livia]